MLYLKTLLLIDFFLLITLKILIMNDFFVGFEDFDDLAFFVAALILRARVTFSHEISKIWEHALRFPKNSEAFRNFRKSRKILLGGFLWRMITVLLSEN